MCGDVLVLLCCVVLCCCVVCCVRCVLVVVALTDSAIANTQQNKEREEVKITNKYSNSCDSDNIAVGALECVLPMR